MAPASPSTAIGTSTTEQNDFPCLPTEATVCFPSVADGLPVWAARQQSRACCTFIEKVSSKLDPPLKLISRCTAKVLFHRFYSRQSFKVHDCWLMATTCIFLAAKVEEDIKKLQEVIDTAHCVRTKQRTKLSEDKASYVLLREKILLCERILLHTIEFHVSVTHPHLHATKLVKQINGNDRLLKATWCLLNDSMHTPVCLKYSYAQIAASAVVLATKILVQNEETSSQVVKCRASLQTMVKSTGRYFNICDPQTCLRIISEILDGYEMAGSSAKGGAGARGALAAAAALAQQGGSGGGGGDAGSGPPKRQRQT